MKTSELSKSTRIRMLVQGPSQSGKTRLLGTFPKPYIFNYEDENIITLTYAGLDAEFDSYTSYEATLAKIVELKKNCPFETIGVDSLTRLYTVLMESVLQLNHRSQPQIQDWGQAHERLKKLIKEFKELSAHLVCTVLQEVYKDEITGDVVGSISLPGKMAAEIPPLFNIFARMKAEPKPNADPEFWLITKPDHRFQAGDKTGKLAFKELPDFDVLWAKINDLPTEEAVKKYMKSIGKEAPKK